jgi:O-antigen/teichoic acid export membrane protein
MLVAWLTSNLILCFATVVVLRRESSLRFHPKLIWQVVKYSAPLGLTSFLSQTYLRFDLLYLGLKATLAEVGLYSIAVLVERISFIPGAVGVASASSYAVLERQTGLQVALSGFRKAALITGLAALGLGATGFWVMEWVFGAAFRESYWLLLLLLPGALLSSLIQAISGFVMYQVGRSTLLWAQVIYLIVLLFCCPLGFSVLGVAGVAGATTLANSFYFFTVVMICKSRVPGFRGLELLPRTDDFHSLIGQGKRFLSSVA